MTPTFYAATAEWAAQSNRPKSYTMRYKTGCGITSVVSLARPLRYFLRPLFLSFRIALLPSPTSQSMQLRPRYRAKLSNTAGDTVTNISAPWAIRSALATDGAPTGSIPYSAAKCNSCIHAFIRRQTCSGGDLIFLIH